VTDMLRMGSSVPKALSWTQSYSLIKVLFSSLAFYSDCFFLYSYTLSCICS